VVIHINADNKTDSNVYVYLTMETKEYILPMLDSIKETDRLFPLTYDSYANDFRDILRKNGLYKLYADNKRGTITLHRFRSFFIGQVDEASSRDYAMRMTNHEMYLPNYGEWSAKKKMDAFKKIEHNITILPENILKSKAEHFRDLENQLKKINQMEGKIQEITDENQRMKRAMDRIKGKKKSN